MRIFSIFYRLFISVAFIINVLSAHAYNSNELRALIFSNPELAKKKLDSLIEISSTLTNREAFLTFNNLGIYYGVYGDYNAAKRAFKQSLVFTSPDSGSYAASLLSLSIVHTKSGNFDSSIQYADSALNIYSNLNDTNGIAKTYGEKGTAYKTAGLLDLAINEYLQAINLLNSMPPQSVNPETISIVQQKLANTYIENKRFDFAAKLYEELLPKLATYSNRVNYQYTVINYAWSLYNLQKYSAGLALLDSLTESNQILNEEVLSLAYTTKADFYQKLNQPNKAQLSYQKALSINKIGSRTYRDKLYASYIIFLNNSNQHKKALEIVQEYAALYNDSTFKPEIYKVFAQTYQHVNKYDLSTQYWEKYSESYLQQVEQTNLQTINQLQGIYQNDLLQNEITLQATENELLQNKVSFRTKILIAFIVLSIALILLGFYLWNSYTLKTKLKTTQLEKIEQEKKFLESQTRIKEENLHLKEQVIQEQKAQLLSSAIESAALNQKIENLIGKIDSRESINLTNELRSLNSNGNHWKVTIEKFKQINPNFIENLGSKFPDLTNGELEFCALVKMNLSYKEIANLLKINHQSVFMKKYRITKKLNIAEDDDFIHLIRNID